MEERQTYLLLSGTGPATGRPPPLVAFERMDGAPLMSAQLAQDKAYSVCAFNGLPTGSGEAG